MCQSQQIFFLQLAIPIKTACALLLKTGFFYFIPKIAVTLRSITAICKLKQGLLVYTHFLYIAEVGYIAFQKYFVFVKRLYRFVMKIFTVVYHAKKAFDLAGV